MRLGSIISRPIVTEKSFDQANAGVYVFKVNLKATKGSVASELKRLYDVDASEIRTVVLPGKKRRVGATRSFTKSAKWKKALVKLKKGQKIELFPKE